MEIQSSPNNIDPVINSSLFYLFRHFPNKCNRVKGKIALPDWRGVTFFLFELFQVVDTAVESGQKNWKGRQGGWKYIFRYGTRSVTRQLTPMDVEKGHRSVQPTMLTSGLYRIFSYSLVLYVINKFSREAEAERGKMAFLILGRIGRVTGDGPHGSRLHSIVWLNQELLPLLSIDWANLDAQGRWFNHWQSIDANDGAWQC